MTSTRRKSAAIALAVIGVAGLSLAAAAQLTVTSDSLAAGTVIVSSCDADGVNVAYTTAFAASNYGVTAVTISGIDVETVSTPATCTGRTLDVTLFNAAGTSLGTQTVTVSTASHTLTLAASAKDVVGAAVVIH